MATTVRELDQTTALLSAAHNQLPCDLPLGVDGVLPAQLNGCFVQASAHPGGGHDRQPILSGIRFGGGTARLYRARAARTGCPFGPRPDLTAALPPGEFTLARPVRETAAPLWHTVATRPGGDRATHVVMAEDGTVLRAEPFALPGAPLVRTVAVTERYLVVLDLPLVYRRAAALLGAAVPYAWQEDRPARIGLLPLRQGGSPRWFAIETCHVSRIVNAFEDQDLVVLDAVRHARPGEPGHVCRWELNLNTGAARPGRRLAGPADLATVDGRWSGRRHRHVFGVVEDELGTVMLSRHDLSTWRTVERPLGTGVRVGQPVFVPRDGGDEGEGWLLVLIDDPVHRCAALLVLDAMDIAGRPVAVVDIPTAMPGCWQSTWIGR